MLHVRCFFFNDTATTEIYTLSLHDALPILIPAAAAPQSVHDGVQRLALIDPLPTETARRIVLLQDRLDRLPGLIRDRKSTRLNSSHANISYAVFCLKKKKNNIKT